jgi:uncharacterized protein (TIGR03435 family)
MRVDRAVLDETGLKGKYDFTLQFTPETTFGPATPSVLKAIEEQLGLKLESRESPVGVLVIDHVEQPTDDAKKSQPHAQGRGSSQSVVAATASAVFETVSVKQNNSGSESSTMNVPTGYGDIFPPAGGAFSGVNVPLVSYIVFAYDLTGNQLQSLLPQLPEWVIKDRFDIQAKANGNPTRDQMRLMMQSLLADRFKLAVHYESQQLPVFALVTQKSSQTGLRIRPHTDNPPCAPPPAASDSDSLSSLQTTIAGGFPSVCRGIIGFSSHPPNRMRVGARDVPIGLFATTLSQIGNIDRPVIDKTGLSGTFDFVFEWTPQADGQPDQHSAPRPAFLQDLREQLGFELESQVGPAQVFAVDHVEKPSEN